MSSSSQRSTGWRTSKSPGTRKLPQARLPRPCISRIRATACRTSNSSTKNGKRISLHQYRGQTLLLTLIYTRCPFPDFCPRVSHEFAAIDHQVRGDWARYGRVHLLSISFDPAHDTPKILRAYGFSCAGSKDSALFTHWEFSTIPPAELPKFADYFALTYKEEGGLITHSLSTAVISPDGKIFR